MILLRLIFFHMILISMIVTAAVFFVAGMHFAAWDQNRDIPESIRSIWWMLALCLIGTWNMIGLVGMVARA